MERESPLGGEDNFCKSSDFDEKSGHVKYKGSLRPDGTRRKDRKIKSETYVPPFRRDQIVDKKSRAASKISSLIQEPENKAGKKKLSIENLNLLKRESPEGGEDNSSKCDELSNTSF